MKDFNAGTKRFDALNALRLGEAAKLAYEAGDVVRSKFGEWGMRGEFVSVVKPPDCDTQAFVAASPEAMVIAFRGTKDYLDFVTDAQFAQTPFRGASGKHGKVHVGFKKGLDGAWPAIRKKIQALRDADQPVWVTGHSLGAALATLAAARLVDEGVEVRGLYTAGSPAVGDSEFAEWFDGAMRGRVFRYVNDLDLVARCPPEGVSFLPPYKHVGKRVQFGADGSVTEESDFARWIHVATALVEIVRRSQSRTMSREQLKAEIRAHIGEPLEDHAMTGYITNLEAARRRKSAASRSPTGLAATLESVFGALRPLWRKPS